MQVGQVDAAERRRRRRGPRRRGRRRCRPRRGRWRAALVRTVPASVHGAGRVGESCRTFVVVTDDAVLGLVDQAVVRPRTRAGPGRRPARSAARPRPGVSSNRHPRYGTGTTRRRRSAPGRSPIGRSRSTVAAAPGRRACWKAAWAAAVAVASRRPWPRDHLRGPAGLGQDRGELAVRRAGSPRPHRPSPAGRRRAAGSGPTSPATVSLGRSPVSVVPGWAVPNAAPYRRQVAPRPRRRRWSTPTTAGSSTVDARGHAHEVVDATAGAEVGQGARRPRRRPTGPAAADRATRSRPGAAAAARRGRGTEHDQRGPMREATGSDPPTTGPDGMSDRASRRPTSNAGRSADPGAWPAVRDRARQPRRRPP